MLVSLFTPYVHDARSQEPKILCSVASCWIIIATDNLSRDFVLRTVDKTRTRTELPLYLPRDHPQYQRLLKLMFIQEENKIITFESDFCMTYTK